LDDADFSTAIPQALGAAFMNNVKPVSQALACWCHITQEEVKQLLRKL